MIEMKKLTINGVTFEIVDGKARQDLKSVASTYETKVDADTKFDQLKHYTDTVASNKASSSHNHDDAYDVKGSADNALATAKSYTDSKTSGFASTLAVDVAVDAHNTSDGAHTDIRNLLTELAAKVNNFLDVNDTTTDQLSEVLTLINNNKGTLDSITSNKINVSDIVDDLSTSSTSKVLSAKQGVVLKELINALQLAVDGKADTDHGHEIDDIVGLQDALNSKATQTSLDTQIAEAKQYTDTVASGKADVEHSHGTEGIENFQATLDELLNEAKEYVNTEVAKKSDKDHNHSSENIMHGSSEELLSSIIDMYILNLDYANTFAFDTTEIVFDTTIGSTTSMLGQAVLGRMVLA